MDESNITNEGQSLQDSDKYAELLKERTEQLEWMMSEYGGNVYISDMHTYELLYLNKNAYETLQKTPCEVIGKKCYQVIQGRTSPCPFCTNAYLKKDETYEWEFYNINLQRTFLIKNRMLNWNGHTARIELSYDMYSPEFQLAKKDQEREAILKTVPAGMARIDARDCKTVLWHNGIFLDMIGYTKEQFEEELHGECRYMHPEDLNRAYLAAQGLKQTGDNVVMEARSYTRSHEERIWTVTLCYISGEDSWDGIPSFYSMGLDITDERNQIETLRNKAENDALTGIYNRAEIENQIKNYIMEKPNSMGALFMIDTDDFKQINDSQGHMVGDAVLTEMAHGMKKCMHVDDIVGRIGGDEFTIFMKNISSKEAAEDKAEELLKMFHHLFEADKSDIKITCSIGIALYPNDGSTFQEMYSCADKALYQAKVLGKNKYVSYGGHTMKHQKISYEPTRTSIDSETKYSEALDNIVRYIFRILYQMQEKDQKQGFETILEIIGKRFDISRAYIFESDESGRFGSNTYEWCNKGIKSQIEQLQNIDYYALNDYQSLFNDNGIFYCRDIHSLKPEQERLFAKQHVHSTLQCAFMQNHAFEEFIGFDECTGLRLWTEEEVSTLTLISQLILTFLKQKKMEKQLEGLQRQNYFKL